MRTTAQLCALVVLFVIACRSTPTPQPRSKRPPPARVGIALDAELRDRLALGLPLTLELSVDETPVGTCNLMFDIWNDAYRVWISRGDVKAYRDPLHALQSCVEVGSISGDVDVVVREVDRPRPLYTPPSYPIF